MTRSLAAESRLPRGSARRTAVAVGRGGRYKLRLMAALRIVLVGQAAFGEKTLERLAAKHQIVAVYTPPDAPGGKVDPLKARAAALGVPVHQPRSMKTEEVYEQFKRHGADLAVLAFVTLIVPDRVIALPRLGTICFHPSLLPLFRGGSAINWQIIRGETKGGITVFWTDAGIDTGPILLQQEIDIGSDETTGSFYYDKVFPAGVDGLERAVDAIAEGRAPRIMQDESRASYDPLCRDEHVGIDWSRPAREIYDLVRGADPQPGAWVLHRGQKLRFYECRLAAGGRGEPGTLLAVGESGAEVALAGARLIARRLRFGDSPKKVPPADLAAGGMIVPGDRLDAGRAS